MFALEDPMKWDIITYWKISIDSGKLSSHWHKLDKHTVAYEVDM